MGTGVPKVKRIRALDPLRPGRHTRKRQSAARTPAAPPAPSASPRTPARAELERRQTRRPAEQLGVRETPRKGGDYGARNYPPSSKRRDTRELAIRDDLGMATDTRRGRVGPKEGTRQQLAKRGQSMGQPTEAAVRSRRAGTLLAQTSTYDKAGKARGKAARPAARLPTGDPAHGTPVDRGRRHPQQTGRAFSEMGVPAGGGSFADRFFR